MKQWQIEHEKIMENSHRIIKNTRKILAEKKEKCKCDCHDTPGGWEKNNGHCPDCGASIIEGITD